MSATQPHQTAFGWLFPHARPTVRVDDVALALQIDTTQVRAHVDAGNFLAVGIGDAANPKREHLRILRYSVEGWMLYQADRRGNPRPPGYVDPMAAQWAAQLKAEATRL